MKNKDLSWSARSAAIGVLMALPVLAIGQIGPGHWRAPDRLRLPASFSGLLNDYTPPAPTVAGGPYEMHGKWSLQLDEERGSAIFSAEMTMETADFANTDASHDPTKLGPHTHHISVRDGSIHNDPADPINWKTSCPTFKPPVSNGFVITGTAFITGNGGNPPFGNPSSVTMCVLGGTLNPALPGAQAYVEFSNFTLAFATNSLASSHFGTQAINGVVARCERPWTRESSDCRVAVVE